MWNGINGSRRSIYSRIIKSDDLRKKQFHVVVANVDIDVFFFVSSNESFDGVYKYNIYVETSKY